MLILKTSASHLPNANRTKRNIVPFESSGDPVLSASAIDNSESLAFTADPEPNATFTVLPGDLFEVAGKHLSTMNNLNYVYFA